MFSWGVLTARSLLDDLLLVLDDVFLSRWRTKRGDMGSIHRMAWTWAGDRLPLGNEIATSLYIGNYALYSVLFTEGTRREARPLSAGGRKNHLVMT